MKIRRPFGTGSVRDGLHRMVSWTLALFAVLLAGPAAVAQDPIDVIVKIERGGTGVADAAAAAAQLLGRGVKLEQLLHKAASANPVSKNWILSLAQAVADRQPAETTQKTLEAFLADQAGDGEARYWALDRLSQGNPTVRDEMLAGRIEDSSLDIRYEAIELELAKLPSADAAKADEQVNKQTVASYQRLLKSARLPQQINNIAAKLKELGTEVDLRAHFGFVANWQVVGPFDNRQEVGFNAAYPPEADYLQLSKLEPSRKYTGKSGEATWQAATTEQPDGKIDLNPLLANEKVAVVYAYAVVKSPQDWDCQVRLGSANANKVWVNGVEATANNVYHTGSQIDQYIGPANLQRGPNTVLVKVCQNEQTEPWAQDFGFQLRFTDATGLALPVSQ